MLSRSFLIEVVSIVTSISLTLSGGVMSNEPFHCFVTIGEHLPVLSTIDHHIFMKNIILRIFRCDNRLRIITVSPRMLASVFACLIKCKASSPPTGTAAAPSQVIFSGIVAGTSASTFQAHRHSYIGTHTQPGSCPKDRNVRRI